MRRRMIAASALAASLAVAGCGGGESDAQKSAKKTADQVRQAAAEGNVTQLCSGLFTPSLRASFKALSGQPCETIVRTRVAPALATLKIKSASVNKSNTLGVVVISDKSGSNDKLYLVKSGGAWKVNALFEPGIGRLKVPGKTGTTTTKK